jgi:hypothetical protein
MRRSLPLRWAWFTGPLALALFSGLGVPSALAQSTSAGEDGNYYYYRSAAIATATATTSTNTSYYYPAPTNTRPPSGYYYYYAGTTPGGPVAGFYYYNARYAAPANVAAAPRTILAPVARVPARVVPAPRRAAVSRGSNIVRPTPNSGAHDEYAYKS